MSNLQTVINEAVWLLEQKLTQQALDLLLKHYKEGNEIDSAGEGGKAE